MRLPWRLQPWCGWAGPESGKVRTEYTLRLYILCICYDTGVNLDTHTYIVQAHSVHVHMYLHVCTNDEVLPVGGARGRPGTLARGVAPHRVAGTSTLRAVPVAVRLLGLNEKGADPDERGEYFKDES